MEIFKEIKGYEGKYEVSNYGRVRSLICRTSTEPQILKQASTRQQYKSIELSQPSSTFFIHRLVAQAFIDNPNNYPIVNHIDNDPSNNNVSNLEWCTQSQNLRHAQNQGRLYDAQAKGGYVTSNNNKIKAKELALSLVGTTYHSWHIVEYAGNKPAGLTADREYLHCECICGEEQEIYYASILSNTASTMCRKCASKEVSEKRKEIVINTHLNTIVETWKINGVSQETASLLTRNIKFEVSCIYCGFETLLPYPTINTASKPIKKCQSLKCNGKEIV